MTSTPRSSPVSTCRRLFERAVAVRLRWWSLGFLLFFLMSGTAAYIAWDSRVLWGWASSALIAALCLFSLFAWFWPAALRSPVNKMNGPAPRWQVIMRRTVLFSAIGLMVLQIGAFVGTSCISWLTVVFVALSAFGMLASLLLLVGILLLSCFSTRVHLGTAAIILFVAQSVLPILLVCANALNLLPDRMQIVRSYVESLPGVQVVAAKEGPDSDVFLESFSLTVIADGIQEDVWFGDCPLWQNYREADAWYARVKARSTQPASAPSQ